MLVVVEDRDVEPTAQLLLDVEALGRLDVLEVDPAERGRQRGDDPDQLVWVAGVDLQVEDVDPGEPLEEHGLALHDRLGRQRPDVAQAEHGRAVAHDRHEVPLPRVPVHCLGTVLDGEAGTRHARGVGQREVALGHARFRRDDLELPRAWQLVILEHILVADHTLLPGSGRRSEPPPGEADIIDPSWPATASVGHLPPPPSRAPIPTERAPMLAQVPFTRPGVRADARADTQNVDGARCPAAMHGGREIAESGGELFGGQGHHCFHVVTAPRIELECVEPR